MKRRFVWLALAAIAVGVAALLYPGPGRAIVRGHVGDVGAAMGVYALFGLTAWSLRARIVATLGFSLAIELGQLVWSSVGRSGLGALTLGSVFDPWDLLAYAIGTAIGVGWERVSSASPWHDGENDVGRAVDRERDRQRRDRDRRR